MPIINKMASAWRDSVPSKFAEKTQFWAGLPDLSQYNIPKREKIYQMTTIQIYQILAIKYTI
jgi:hypothetical protein